MVQDISSLPGANGWSRTQVEELARILRDKNVRSLKVLQPTNKHVDLSLACAECNPNRV